MKRILVSLFATLAIVFVTSCPQPVAPPGPPGLGSSARWARTVIAGTNESLFNGIASDTLGHTYAVGAIRGTSEYDFGNGIKAQGTSANQNIVIVKYDPDGTALWARTVVSGAAETVFHGVAVNSLGDIFAIGTISNAVSMDFGNSCAVAGSYSGGRNVLIAKYNNLGETQWVRSTTGTSLNYAWYAGVAADNSGNAYAVGCITYSAAFNFGNDVSAAGPHIGWHTIIVKYNSSGNAQWAKTVTISSNDSEFKAVTCDGAGNVAAVGFLYGFHPFDFGNGKTVEYADGGGYIPVIVKYGNGGTTLWAKTVESAPNSCFFYGITRDSANNLYAVGSAMTTDTYGFGNAVTVDGAFDSDDNALLVKYDANGTAQWARSTISGNGESTYYGATADASDNIWTVGFIRGPGSFGFGNGISAAGTDSNENPLIVKYDVTGTAQKAYTITGGDSAGSSGCLYRAVATDNLNRPHAAGTLFGDGTYSFGDGVSANGPVLNKPGLLAVQYP